MNDAEASSGPSYGEACSEDASCRSCPPWANKDVPSDLACDRIQKREKLWEAYEV